MSSLIQTSAAAVECREPTPAQCHTRRVWQTPRVVTGLEGSEIAAAEGIGDLLGDHFFVGS